MRTPVLVFFYNCINDFHLHCSLPNKVLHIINDKDAFLALSIR